jgi:lipid II:glycine glycyltransferase (peptidoglycan interpeptide bridge formation enzyme)
LNIREARPDELATWDARAVDAPGGHVYQSMAWATHREASGWQSKFLLTQDGGAVLGLMRPWSGIPGGSAYIPRGPAGAGFVEGARLAARQVAAAHLLAAAGSDVVAADPEVPADMTAYRDVITAAGFRPIEEIQPSRHRVSLPLGRHADEAGVLGEVAKSTRQRIRAAERDGVQVVRHDARCGPDGEGEGFVRPTTPTPAALDRFYDLLLETGERRGFSFGPRQPFVAWWTAAQDAGHLVLLEAVPPDSADPIAGLILYRHGRRFSTVHSGDHASSRTTFPGALHLLRWRAIQLAIRERCVEMDLGGVDTAGARGEPSEGDPLYGLYQHKRAFGGRWLELTGAHERVYDARGYALGRVAGQIRRRIRR